MNKPLDWNDYFIEVAKTISLRSNCIRANVGAVIVDEDRFIQSTGYNGVPKNIKACTDKGSCHRIDNNIESGTRYETCRSIHAEMNAIIQAGADKCKGSMIFIYGHSQVCIMCKRFIIQSGIKLVFLKKDVDSKLLVFVPESDWNDI